MSLLVHHHHSNSNINEEDLAAAAAIDQVTEEEEAAIYTTKNFSELVQHADAQQLKSQGSLLMEFIRRLRPGLDLYRISVPRSGHGQKLFFFFFFFIILEWEKVRNYYINIRLIYFFFSLSFFFLLLLLLPLPDFSITLEPVSLLEKFTEYSCPPAYLLETPRLADPETRFLNVLRYYLMGLKFTPKNSIYSSKPYNPILGETFSCSWTHNNSATAAATSTATTSTTTSNNRTTAAAATTTTTTYMAEQVSHHPPISAFYMENRDIGLVYDGYVAPSTKFHGNSVSTFMNGSFCVTFLRVDAGEDQDRHQIQQLENDDSHSSAASSTNRPANYSVESDISNSDNLQYIPPSAGASATDNDESCSGASVDDEDTANDDDELATDSLSSSSSSAAAAAAAAHLHESYFAFMPSIVARGILWGSSYIEVNEYMRVNCPKTGYEAKIYFKPKVSYYYLSLLYYPSVSF